MNFLSKITFLTLLAGFIFSCSYDKEVIEPAPEVNICDSIPAKYTTDVVPIFTNNCSPCHVDGGSFAGISLDDYTSASGNVAKILSAIKHEGNVKMPKNADKLSDSDIQIIQCWVDGGALDN